MEETPDLATLFNDENLRQDMIFNFLSHASHPIKKLFEQARHAEPSNNNNKRFCDILHTYLTKFYEYCMDCPRNGFDLLVEVVRTDHTEIWDVHKDLNIKRARWKSGTLPHAIAAQLPFSWSSDDDDKHLDRGFKPIGNALLYAINDLVYKVKYDSKVPKEHVFDKFMTVVLTYNILHTLRDDVLPRQWQFDAALMCNLNSQATNVTLITRLCLPRLQGDLKDYMAAAHAHDKRQGACVKVFQLLHKMLLRGVCWRDVKSANILYDKAEEFVITDLEPDDVAAFDESICWNVNELLPCLRLPSFSREQDFLLISPQLGPQLDTGAKEAVTMFNMFSLQLEMMGFEDSAAWDMGMMEMLCKQYALSLIDGGNPYDSIRKFIPYMRFSTLTEQEFASVGKPTLEQVDPLSYACQYISFNLQTYLVKCCINAKVVVKDETVYATWDDMQLAAYMEYLIKEENRAEFDKFMDHAFVKKATVQRRRSNVDFDKLKRVIEYVYPVKGPAAFRADTNINQVKERLWRTTTSTLSYKAHSIEELHNTRSNTTADAEKDGRVIAFMRFLKRVLKMLGWADQIQMDQVEQGDGRFTFEQIKEIMKLNDLSMISDLDRRQALSTSSKPEDVNEFRASLRGALAELHDFKSSESFKSIEKAKQVEIKACDRYITTRLNTLGLHSYDFDSADISSLNFASLETPETLQTLTLEHMTDFERALTIHEKGGYLTYTSVEIILKNRISEIRNFHLADKEFHEGGGADVVDFICAKFGSITAPISIISHDNMMRALTWIQQVHGDETPLPPSGAMDRPRSRSPDAVSGSHSRSRSSRSPNAVSGSHSRSRSSRSPNAVSGSHSRSRSSRSPDAVGGSHSRSRSSRSPDAVGGSPSRSRSSRSPDAVGGSHSRSRSSRSPDAVGGSHSRSRSSRSPDAVGGSHSRSRSSRSPDAVSGSHSRSRTRGTRAGLRNKSPDSLSVRHMSELSDIGELSPGVSDSTSPGELGAHSPSSEHPQHVGPRQRDRPSRRERSTLGNSLLSPGHRPSPENDEQLYSSDQRNFELSPDQHRLQRPSKQFTSSYDPREIPERERETSARKRVRPTRPEEPMFKRPRRSSPELKENRILIRGKIRRLMEQTGSKNNSDRTLGGISKPIRRPTSFEIAESKERRRLIREKYARSLQEQKLKKKHS